MDFYNEIFKRKSFHFFVNGETTSEDVLNKVKNFIKGVKPLYDDIKVDMVIVPEKDTSCARGADYCILFYSETKGEYLRNIGYIGEQIDLYLSSIDVGSLWYGIGWPKRRVKNDLTYVIMMGFKKMPSNTFRKDMFKAKRKSLIEMWSGEEMNIANIVRFTPSACNTQPWFVKNKGNELLVYRYKKAGKRGIIPANKVLYYNKIDIGIFLFILETCLIHECVSYNRTLLDDTNDSNVEMSLIAKYTL